MAHPQRVPPANLQRFLDRLTARSVLTDDEQQAILDLPAYATQVPANRDFVHLGERVDHASLVVEGIVGRFGQNSEGGRQITAIHLPGDMADLHSVVQPEGTSALQALSTTTILRIPHASLRTLAARYPAIAEAFWRDCMVDASILSQWVVNVGRRDARARMAHLLCEMATRCGVRGEGEVEFKFPVTQVHLGNALGLTCVHVNRTLKVLRDDGLAILHGRMVHILDWKALVRAGDFDPAYLQADNDPEQRLRIAAAA